MRVPESSTSFLLIIFNGEELGLVLFIAEVSMVGFLKLLRRTV